jgi:hypothetical protein
MDRFNPHYVLAISYALARLFIAAVGAVTFSPWLAGLAVFGAGFCVSGSQVGANAPLASDYPTDCRAAGGSSGACRCAAARRSLIRRPARRSRALSRRLPAARRRGI